MTSKKVKALTPKLYHVWQQRIATSLNTLYPFTLKNISHSGQGGQFQIEICWTPLASMLEFGNVSGPARIHTLTPFHAYFRRPEYLQMGVTVSTRLWQSFPEYDLRMKPEKMFCSPLWHKCSSCDFATNIVNVYQAVGHVFGSCNRRCK